MAGAWSVEMVSSMVSTRIGVMRAFPLPLSILPSEDHAPKRTGWTVQLTWSGRSRKDRSGAADQWGLDALAWCPTSPSTSQRVQRVHAKPR